ncbi:MAG: hypothetical protein F7O42_10540 [Opitutae bacterium]|nr:hypothetical protein [Opitutae bacterium]
MKSVIQLTVFLAFVAPACAQAVIPIGEIQGSAHRSPLEGREVTTEGIVTKVDKNGFYLQSARPDKFSETSEAIYVYRPNSNVEVGNLLRLDGRVEEWKWGKEEDPNLTLTQLRGKNIGILSKRVALPGPMVLDTLLRNIPEAIKKPGSPFDPGLNAMDFWESLEHMRVVFRNSIIIGPRSPYDEIAVRAARAGPGPVTKKGGLKLTRFDSNSARVLVALRPENEHAYNTGDRIRIPIEGVVTYSFGNFKIVTTKVTSPPTPAKAPTPQVPSIPDRALTIASFNVENLYPGSSDEKFAALAAIITGQLLSPTILGLQEIQDNSGPADDDVVDADATLKKLIRFIREARGPDYRFTQINPINRADGGRPGSNIRNAFLYDPQQVNWKSSYRLRHASFDRSEERNYTGTRKPLVAEFDFEEKEWIVINCHLRSKRGDGPSYGSLRPPVRFTQPQRLEQTRRVRAHVAQLRAKRPRSGIVVLGDLNDFEFSPPLRELSGKGELINLVEDLPVEDRYTYIFQGMSQALDHILVTPDLARRAGIFIAHVNADKSVQLRSSDHDPILAWFPFH